jgi:hypothetical protein
MSARTGQEISSFALTKPSTWKPDPAAAAQRFTAMESAEPVELASIDSDDSSDWFDSSAAQEPDFEGLTQLLQEDLLAAAATTPSVLDKFAGRNSYLAKVVAAVAAGDAPASVSTWQAFLLLLAFQAPFSSKSAW